ncbi:HAD-IIB family hydrolase [Aciduricibacillus chroicocephali]|uniref:HAD-IIB family hydrolase n=1 Tax=Aciduricibacillus chroicocephali TaxID=3054939 RepID=A0ABY9KTU7_9BACI|nr:HAD-IIB family hydrolase [Bacillaceae bacterium 44XB]
MQNISHCLATDLDGTFVGDREALLELLKHYKQLPDRVFLVYITGRHLASALELIKQENLPIPDVLATDIGTAIYTFESGKWIADTAWERQMKDSWFPERITEIAAACPGLENQGLPENRRVSFYASSLSDVEEFEQSLIHAAIPHNLIYSSGRDLDILPENSGKAAALEFILNRYGIDHERLLVAGDSGNDFDMLNLGYRSVVVGNGLDDLAELEDRETLYRAKARCAGGILEAWQHFFPSRENKKVPASE